MADRKILTHLDFLKASELQNALVHKLAAAPGSPVEGQLYFDTVGHRLYVYNGTIWVAADSSQLTASAGILRTTNNFTANLDPASLEIALEKIRIAEAAAGNGLGWAAGVLAAKVAGPLLVIEGDNITANTTVGSASEKVATQAFAESVAAGLDWKQSVKCATTANVIIASALLEGQKIDNIELKNGDRVLVKNQTSKKENGIYTVAGPPVRSTDADATGEMSGGSAVWVESGVANGDTGWVITTPDGSVTIGTSEITWTQFTGAGSILAEGGIGKTGNELFVEALAGLIQEPNGLKVDPAVVALLAGTNPFTTVQTINLAASGAALLAKRAGTTIATLEITALMATLASAASLTLGAAAGNTTVSATTGIILEPGAGQTISAQTHKIVSVVDPTAAQDAATKNYVDTSAGRKFTAKVGTGAATAIEVTHGLGTRDVLVEVYRNSTPWDTVEPTVERTSTEIVTLRFNTAPTSEQFIVVVKS